jgi:hypothetical protein
MSKESKNSKPRGRPKKGHISPDMPEAAPKKNFLWTDSMENYLLELRLQNYKRGFLDAKDKVCISRTWASILMDFNIKFGTDVSSEQLKNKFNALKSSYREVKSTFVETGNTPGKELPANFDTLNEFFKISSLPSLISFLITVISSFNPWISLLFSSYLSLFLGLSDIVRRALEILSPI